MRFFEKIKAIERIDQLIRMRATGSARDLAKRLDVSKSTMYEIIDTMKNMGAEIEYCSHRKSYYYSHEKELAIGFVEKSKVYGGYSLMSSFLGQLSSIFELSRA
jgi:transposase